MKQLLYILGIIVLVIVVVVYLQQDGGLFKSQLLTQPETTETKNGIEITSHHDCLKFSEYKANECLLELALKENDADICDKITKSSDKKSCQRKVELYQ